VPSSVSEAIPFAATSEALGRVTREVEAATPLAAGGVFGAETRRRAFAAYEALPPPGARMGRAWRHDYSKLAPAGGAWRAPRVLEAPRRPVAQANEPSEQQPEYAARLIHIGPAAFEPMTRISERAQAQGVVVVPIAEGLRSHAETFERASGSAVPWLRDKFAALAVAFQNAGAFVYVPDGVRLDEPIGIGYLLEADAVFPYTLVVLGAGAKATIVEHLSTADAAAGAPSFASGIVEIVLGERAEIDYTVVQQAGRARLFTARGARCGKDSQVRFHIAELGGDLSRSAVTVALAEPGAHAEIDGFFFNAGDEHVDFVSETLHLAGDTTSVVTIKSAATDRGQGRFVGNIVIKEHAHGSDASLRDDAMLLSKFAHIDSVPALEIAANDVKAFHGATVGSIDDEELFYAESRGISRREAERMIALGFFEPVLARFPTEALREQLRVALANKLPPLAVE